MECIILAGGLGTRLRPALPDTAKPLAPIEDKPFLYYLIRHWKEQGIKRFILSVGYKSEQFVDFIKNYNFDKNIELSIEDQPLGTGGALLNALPKISDSKSFLLLNGDTYFPIPLKPLLKFHQESNADILMTLALKENTHQRYMGVDFDGKNSLISLKNSPSKDCWVNSGTYVIKKSSLNKWHNSSKQPLSFENDILSNECLNSSHRIYTFPVDGANFIDIGIPEDYTKAQRYFSKDKN